jgi:hypothetical protein
MSERLQYTRFNDDQLVVQLTSGGAACTLRYGAPVHEVARELRDLAERLERGVRYRAGLQANATPTRSVEPETIDRPGWSGSGS